ncbi:efflux transporter outer membrane subunit [Sulfurirhabdus autotrophica]|uniref:NodT family efflux transporter outer membrane factor (OMF) lipoprotein n=1 Tax=Sulfurirhabdus autotrophica TaxID=1706046 RepID=A0A4R3YC76_9PROT|nr:efflux transporter outer membrane subunit [Sulfurirhabdus autotrophica]TCV90045.1 NodT family efflux transporter outer membrane factor (OMF) lipoprotein [Sulfurirhabdus autotrophica]
MTLYSDNTKWLPRLNILALLVPTTMLFGCASVGPDFIQPEPPADNGYNVKKLPEHTVSAPGARMGEMQNFAIGKKVPETWWQNFGSSKLNAFVDQALHASPSLAAAQATLLQAQQTYAAQSGSSQYPQVNAKLGAQRQGTNNSGMGLAGGDRVFELYNAGVAVSYNLDLFGGNKRALESYAAQIDYQHYQLEGARLTLAANVVTAAMMQAQYAAQILASNAILAAQQSQLDITRKRVKLGAVSRSDELSLQTQVEQTRAGIPTLRNKLEQTNHLLAVLAGQAPGATEIPQFHLEDFSLPTELPVVVPSELVRQRPDIQASEALLHVASAQYGVAISNGYPQINLTANLGSQALTASSLFGAGSLVWGLAGQIAQPLFNAGLKAGVKSAEAGFDAAAANYRQTVLQALRNVADVLRTLDNDAQTMQAQVAANEAAQSALNLIQQQYQLGGLSYLQLLSAQQQTQQTRINLIAAQIQRLTDTAALYQAMGGGWVAGDSHAKPVDIPKSADTAVN